MNRKKNIILRIAAITSIILVLSILAFIFVIYKNGITSSNSDTTPSLTKVETTTPEFEQGKEIFMEDCITCHVAKGRRHDYLLGVVDKVGIPYLKLYLSKQDSLLQSQDAYAVKLNEDMGNNGAIHKFDYSEPEFKALIEYLK